MKRNPFLAITALALLALAAPALATNGYFSLGYGTPYNGMAGAGQALHLNTLASATNPATIAFVKGYDVSAGPLQSEPRVHGHREPVGLPGHVRPRARATTRATARPSSCPRLAGAPGTCPTSFHLGLAIYGNGGMNTTSRTPSSAGARRRQPDAGLRRPVLHVRVRGAPGDRRLADPRLAELRGEGPLRPSRCSRRTPRSCRTTAPTRPRLRRPDRLPRQVRRRTSASARRTRRRSRWASSTTTPDSSPSRATSTSRRTGPSASPSSRRRGGDRRRRPADLLQQGRLHRESDAPEPDAGTARRGRRRRIRLGGRDRREARPPVGGDAPRGRSAPATPTAPSRSARREVLFNILAPGVIQDHVTRRASRSSSRRRAPSTSRVIRAFSHVGHRREPARGARPAEDRAEDGPVAASSSATASGSDLGRLLRPGKRGGLPAAPFVLPP